MSGFANEAYIVVTLNLLSLELKCNNPEKRTVMHESFGRPHQITSSSFGFFDVVDGCRPRGVGGRSAPSAGEVWPDSGGPWIQVRDDRRRRGGPARQRRDKMKQSPIDIIPTDTPVTARTPTGRHNNAAANAPPDQASSFHVYICIKSASDSEAENAARNNNPAAAVSLVRH